jgi:hypothetical protein
MQIHWIDFHDRPAPQGRTLLLKTRNGIIYTGTYRNGNLGEPQQMEYGWRTQCCGRFSTPAYWSEYSENTCSSDSTG